MEVLATLPSDVRSVGEARRFTDTALNEWGCDQIADTAVLLVSELASNAILHARSDIRIFLSRELDQLKVKVCDRSPVIPRPRRFGVESATGRGLALVEQLSVDWGVQREAGGKCVWFTLSVDGVEPSFEFDLDAVEPL